MINSDLANMDASQNPVANLKDGLKESRLKINLYFPSSADGVVVELRLTDLNVPSNTLMIEF